MRLALLTAMRDSASTHHLRRFHRQVRELEAHLRSPLTLIIGEGDSRDHTVSAILEEARERKASAQRRTFLVDVTHGGPRWGSTEEPARLAALSKVFNRILDAIPEEGDRGADVVVWVESDLRWEATTLMRLADIIYTDTQVGAVAPMVFAGAAQYDTWGCRLTDGRRLPPFAPYFPEDYLAASQYGDLVEMGSVGSCLAMQPPLAKHARVFNGGAIVEWCAFARKGGYRIYLDRVARIEHDHAGTTAEEKR